MENTNIRESIWNSWVNENNHCSECPAHDFAYRPRYGGGDINSHVMIVLRDPNDDRDPESTDLVEPKTKNESWHYGYSADNNWDMMDDYLNPIAKRIDCCDNADDIYFTNAHKCPKLSGKSGNFEGQDINALDKCKDYIEMEIKSVQPDVVVALSKHSKNAVGDCNSIDFDGSKSVTDYVEDWVTSGKRFYGSNPSVVVGLHPSPGKLHLNLKDWPGERDHNTWYFKQLAKSVNKALDGN